MSKYSNNEHFLSIYYMIGTVLILNHLILIANYKVGAIISARLSMKKHLITAKNGNYLNPKN